VRVSFNLFGSFGSFDIVDNPSLLFEPPALSRWFFIIIS
jgi:hypothetical protein